VEPLRKALVKRLDKRLLFCARPRNENNEEVLGEDVEVVAAVSVVEDHRVVVGLEVGEGRHVDLVDGAPHHLALGEVDHHHHLPLDTVRLVSMVLQGKIWYCTLLRVCLPYHASCSFKM
jgi:hypothetical protein